MQGQHADSVADAGGVNTWGKRSCCESDVLKRIIDGVEPVTRILTESVETPFHDVSEFGVDVD